MRRRRGSQAGGLEIFNDEVIEADAFAKRSGISGVDLSGFPAARWYADLLLLDLEMPILPSTIAVEGIAADNAVHGVVEQLTFSFSDRI